MFILRNHPRRCESTARKPLLGVSAGDSRASCLFLYIPESDHYPSSPYINNTLSSKEVVRI